MKSIWWLTLCIPAVVPGPSLPQLCPSELCAPLCQHSPGRYRPPLDLLPKWQESCLQGKKRNKPRMWETLSFAVSKQHTQTCLLDVENNINSLHFSLWSSKVVLLAGNLAMIQANQGSRFIGFPQITKILGHKKINKKNNNKKISFFKVLSTLHSCAIDAGRVTLPETQPNILQ